MTGFPTNHNRDGEEGPVDVFEYIDNVIVTARNSSINEAVLVCSLWAMGVKEDNTRNELALYVHYMKKHPHEV